METQDLAGKVAIITGAGSGIGEATARALAARGVRVVLAGRRADRLEALAASLDGSQTLAVPTDVGRAADVQRLIERALSHFGRVDILFANAGQFVQGAIAEVDVERLVAQIDTNLTGVVRCIKAVLPSMLAQRSGDILVTSSISGHTDIDNEAVYSATKHAVGTLVNILRREVAPRGIRVATISPGIVLNEIWGVTDPAAVAAGLAAHRGLCSEDIADLAVYMLSLPARVTLRDIVALGQGQII
ncbi:MAG TPA: SDR family oxidoreductase [Chloroflexota bacterium]|nr:SDR family oxidoreductase [Chloroflexota bacterium]